MRENPQAGSPQSVDPSRGLSPGSLRSGPAIIQSWVLTQLSPPPLPVPQSSSFYWLSFFETTTKAQNVLAVLIA